MRRLIIILTINCPLYPQGVIIIFANTGEKLDLCFLSVILGRLENLPVAWERDHRVLEIVLELVSSENNFEATNTASFSIFLSNNEAKAEKKKRKWSASFGLKRSIDRIHPSANCFAKITLHGFPFRSIPFQSSKTRFNYHGMNTVRKSFWAKQTERVCLFSLFRCSAKVSPPKRRLKHRNVNLFEAFQSNERSFYVENLARGKSTGFYARYFTPFGYSNSRLYYSHPDVSNYL